MGSDYDHATHRMRISRGCISERPTLCGAPLQGCRPRPGFERDRRSRHKALGDHFGLTEGPVWAQEGKSGHLLFSDCAANVIYKWAPGAALSVFLENSGSTGQRVPLRPFVTMCF